MKEFTKDDLKTGMLVTLRNGEKCIVLKDYIDSCGNSINILRPLDGIGIAHINYYFNAFEDDLTWYENDESLDIIKVETCWGTTIWERKNRKKKYTYEQIKEILGEEFEIVKE